MRDAAQIIHEGEVRQAYRDGYDDGTWVALFGGPALDPDADVVHRIFGRRAKVTVEWLDEPAEQTQRHLTERTIRARRRSEERLG